MGNLNFPSFADFLEDMGDAHLDSLQNDALRSVQLNIGMGFDLSVPDDTKRFVAAMFSLNQRWTLLMLQDYHNWLIEKLEEKAIHLI